MLVRRQASSALACSRGFMYHQRRRLMLHHVQSHSSHQRHLLVGGGSVAEDTIVRSRYDERTYHHHRRLSSISSSASELNAETTINSQSQTEAGSTSTPTQPSSSIHIRPYFQIRYNDVYEVNMPPGHRFPMEKYREVRLAVQEKIGGFTEVDCGE